MLLTEEEKIKIFEKIWTELEPTVERQLHNTLRSQIETEMTSVIKGYCRTYVIKILEPILAAKAEEIRARIEKKTEYSLSKMIESIPEVIKWTAKEDIERALREGFRKAESRMWDVIEKLGN